MEGGYSASHRCMDEQTEAAIRGKKAQKWREEDRRQQKRVYVSLKKKQQEIWRMMVHNDTVQSSSKI